MDFVISVCWIGYYMSGISIICQRDGIERYYSKNCDKSLYGYFKNAKEANVMMNNTTNYEVIRTMVAGRAVTLHWKPEVDKISGLIEKGVVPIEMAEGTTSYVDGHEIDHHNDYAANPAACIISLKYYGECAKGGQFMANHVDLDCVASAAVLLGLIPKDQVEEFVYWAGKDDTDPLSPELRQTPVPEMMKKVRAWKDATSGPKTSGWAWIHGLNLLYDLFVHPEHWMEKIASLEKREEERQKIAEDDYNFRIESVDGRAIFIGPSRVWGFDIQMGRIPEKDINTSAGWRHQLIVSYVATMGKITMSCPNDAVATELFGKGGMSNIYPKLEEFMPTGWGGRAAVGGSGRNTKLTLEQAQEAFHYLVDNIMTK